MGMGQLLQEIFSHYSIALFSQGTKAQYLVLLLDLVFHSNGKYLELVRFLSVPAAEISLGLPVLFCC